MNKLLKAEDLLLILSNALRDLEVQEIKEHNRNFNRQIAKAKEIGNISGKMIAMTGQQLYAAELGADIEVHLLGIKSLVVENSKFKRIENSVKELKA
jgi:predicted HAD superfamily phosphohydrolase YqeG